MESGLLLGIITVVLAATAVMITRAQARREHEAAVHDAFVRISEIFISYPEIRPIFYQDEAKTSDDAVPHDRTAELRSNSVAEMLLDTLEVAWSERNTRSAYRIYFTEVFQNSPFLVEWARTHQQHYPKALVALALSARLPE